MPSLAAWRDDDDVARASMWTCGQNYCRDETTVVSEQCSGATQVVRDSPRKDRPYRKIPLTDVLKRMSTRADLELQ